MDEPPDWPDLCRWFETATLPTTAYRLNSAVFIDEPIVSHGWLKGTIAAGCKGLVRRAVAVRLRALRKIFGEKER